MKTVADILAQTIRTAGIDTVFGLPGGENAEVLDALRRHGLAFVLVRNESSGLFMADATARLTGRPSIALTTLGPGAANAYCGMAHAYLDRSPILLITAQSDGRTLDRYTHQVIDLLACFRPVTKLSRELSDVETQGTVEDALRLTMSGRPGPVHLAVSAFMAGQVARDDALIPVPARGRSASAADLEAAKSFLATARRPIIVAGLGLEPEEPYAALRQLAEATQAPVVVTPKAKGALPSDHPLSAGTFGLSQSDPSYEIVNESDCIVAVGFDVVEMERLWDQPQPIVWIARWENADPVLPTVKHELVGAVTPLLEQFAQGTYDQHPRWGAYRVAAYREALTLQKLPPPGAGRILPQTVLSILRKHLPRQAVITTDVGAHKICTALAWPALEPNSYLLSNGLSSMGYGLPAAIAAARVTGETTVCIIGDGGLAMVVGELGLLRELGLPVIVVVMNDSALDLIRSAQLRRGNPVFGTEFANPDFTKIAQAYDMDCFRVATEEACETAIQAAVAASRPTLIETMIDPVGYPTTPAVT